MRKVLFCFVCLFMGMAVYAQNNVRLIRNATLKIQYAGQTLLVDPMLGKKGTEMSALGVNLNPRVHLTMPIGEVLDDVLPPSGLSPKTRLGTCSPPTMIR